MHQPSHRENLTLGQRLINRFPSKHKDPQRAAEQMRGLSGLVDFFVPQSKTDVALLAAGPVGKVAKVGLPVLRKLAKMKKGGIDMEDFFVNLDWNKGGKDLWKSVKSLNVKILTGGKDLTDDAISAGKRGWVKKNLNRRSDDIIIESNKEFYASPRSVLIDDTPKNIQKFKEAGGKAILHTSEKKTIKSLNKMTKKDPNLNVYLDLDGVLVDLKSGVEKFK